MKTPVRTVALAAVVLLATCIALPLAGNTPARAEDWNQVADRGIDGGYISYPTEAPSTIADEGNYYVGGSTQTGLGVWRTNGASWTRIATEGIVDARNADPDSMCFYNSKLYLGVGTLDHEGSSMFTWDGSRWTRLTDPVLGNKNNFSNASMTVFEDKLYVGTFNPVQGAEVLSFDGEKWARVNTRGFGGDKFNTGVDFLTQCGDNLYAAVRNFQVGCRLYKYNGGTDWTQVGPSGFNGDKLNNMVGSLFSFETEAGAYMLLGTHYDGDTGCQVWSLDEGGGTLDQLVADGFGDPKNFMAASMEYYNGNVFIGTRNDERGFEIWSNNGTDWNNWTNRMRGGLGRYVSAMKLDSFAGRLYCCAGAAGGPPMRVFSSTDGAAWTPASDPGFTQHYNFTAQSMATYRGKVYAGTLDTLDGAEIYRRDATGWTPVMTGGFGRVENLEVHSMIEYDGCLYAGTGDLCTVYRYDGSAWTQVSLAGFGDQDNRYISSMVVFDGKLYAGTGGGGEVWCYDGTTWTPANTPMFDVHGNDVVILAVNAGHLYAGTGNMINYKGLVLRYDGGTTWTPVNTPGFGINAEVTTLTSYNGKLYAGLFRKINTRNYVYRWDGHGTADWTAVSGASFGSGNTMIHSAEVFNGKLYMGTNLASDDEGGQVWAYDGSGWRQANVSGFGDRRNYSVDSLLAYGNSLYAGVYNEYYGAQVWQTDLATSFYFAEGTTRPGFEPYFTIANPGLEAADVTITYWKGDGAAAYQNLGVPAGTRATVLPSDVLGVADDAAHDFSAKVECTNGRGIVAERPMYFDYNGRPGGSDVVGAVSPATTFYFAEGTTRPGFDTYFTIANPGGADAEVMLVYARGDGTDAVQNLKVGAGSRATVHPADVLGVGDDAAHDFSTVVACTNGREVVAERPVYFDRNGVTGGTDVMGATAPADSFYFAEGTTRPGFDPYFCLFNPGEETAAATLTYMKGDGTSLEQDMVLQPGSRSTVRAGDVLGVGDDAAHDFSTRVACTNGRDIVVERPMYFLYGPGSWPGGSDVVGAPSPSTQFTFAEGTARPGFEQYFTIQNPGTSAASVSLVYFRGDGTDAAQYVVVPPRSRATVHPSDVLGVGDDAAHDFSTVVQSSAGAPIVVERPMYFNCNGITGGHDVVGFTP